MSLSEYEKTIETQKLQEQIKGSDSSKWLSESYEKVQDFHNKAVPDGTNEVIVEFEMTEDYMNHLKNTAVPQENSSGLTNAKYNTEGLGNSGLRNYGITPEELPSFNNNIVSITER